LPGFSVAQEHGETQGDDDRADEGREVGVDPFKPDFSKYRSQRRKER